MQFVQEAVGDKQGLIPFGKLSHTISQRPWKRFITDKSSP